MVLFVLLFHLYFLRLVRLTLLDTDFSDVKINEMPDMASYHADLNDTIEKRQQKFIRKVGNPYMMRVGKMKVKVSFANNGVSIEEAFKNMLLTV